MGEEKSDQPAPAAETRTPVAGRSYGSFVKKIQNVRQQSKSTVEFVKQSYQQTVGELVGEWCRLFCSLSSCALLGLILPVIEICIGGIFLHQCPIDTRIPVFLLVNGIVALVFSILGCHGNIRKSAEYLRKRGKGETYDEVAGLMSGRVRTVSNFTQSVLSLFLFVWVVAGAVWVFGVRDTYHQVPAEGTLPTTDPMYCNPVAFKLSYWMIIFQLVCYGAAILFVLIAFLCLCVISCCVSGSDEERLSFAKIENGAESEDEAGDTEAKETEPMTEKDEKTEE